MKILKIFGLVVGIHVFALILIFANPGCSATSKPSPVPSDTVASPAQPPPTITMPNVAPAGAQPEVSPAPISGITFNPDAPATASAGGVDGRFRPTRPKTPEAATLVAEPVADVTPATTYTVVSGDNLWNLSKRFNVTTTALAAANNIKISTVLRPGQKLIIPGKPASATAAATAKPAAAQGKTAETITAAQPVRASGDAVKHKVQNGETLSTIARQYGVRQGEIAVVNNITDPQKIRAGDELIIPGWQTPPSKSGKSAQKDGKSSAQKSTGTPTLVVEEPTVRPAAEVPVIRVDEPPPSPKGN